ncbi:CsbD family protein [Nesterenkonia alkaliphila]|uniref:CsbD family protein n=1 Tax=Nesterenkonia alkaliphila TaxID=1463631 RepID=A0A7K1UEV1_9MICC|nr:CsbD family protein [Nesterenkonia alkaliphila]MVT25007.1 CsbD family protein [Nesterenkonia alkaliphila]GFZ87154.1 CsbD family protein [Nesterenkonia alkaliphila]
MGLGEKFDAAKDKVSGSTKETAGKATGDSQLEGEGKADKTQGKFKDAKESVKDAASDAKDQIKGFTGNKDDGR